MSDIYTDKIFENDKYHTAKFNYSRLFCDVEKFTDPTVEPLAKFGMGPIYNKIYKVTLIGRLSEKDSTSITSDFYLHHQQLDLYTEKRISVGNELLVIDCHSFSGKVATRLFGEGEYPDLCIRFDDEYKDKNDIQLIYELFEANGYSVAYNYPFEGSLVPNVAFKNTKITKKVKSVMIELNKRVYLDNLNSLVVLKLNRLRKVIALLCLSLNQV